LSRSDVTAYSTLDKHLQSTAAAQELLSNCGDVWRSTVKRDWIRDVAALVGVGNVLFVSKAFGQHRRLATSSSQHRCMVDWAVTVKRCGVCGLTRSGRNLYVIFEVEIEQEGRAVAGNHRAMQGRKHKKFAPNPLATNTKTIGKS